ncbi:MAG: heme ABC transporter ATP-binding protein, partial [Thaumarchaeota archaeon]|nr:heme ABC transporter ATP-binding protein [Nitrososphaerota archaeon]
GLVPSMKVEENLMLRSYRYPPYSNGFLLNLKEIRSSVNSLINRFGIVATPETLARNLSGGNTQRLLLARELSHMPRLIVACYPTRGLDVRSANYVKGLLLEHRNRGAAIILISEDLEELLEVSDRILVMREGRIVGEVKGELATAERLGMLMGG